MRQSGGVKKSNANAVHITGRFINQVTAAKYSHHCLLWRYKERGTMGKDESMYVHCTHE
jgi:hypothetical protein